MSQPQSQASDALVLRTAAVWGTFVLASRDLRSGDSLEVGEGERALYAKPDASGVADLPIRAVGGGWVLDASGATGGVLHLRGRQEDPRALGESGAPIPIVPGDYGVLSYGSFSLFFQFARAAPAPRARLRVDLSLVLAFLFALLTLGGGLLLLYMLYPQQELAKPIELTSPKELETRYRVTPPEPEPAPGGQSEGAAGKTSKAPEKSAGPTQRAPGPKRPAPQPSGRSGGGLPASAMTQVLEGAVGQQVLQTLGSISSVSEALGELGSSGVVLGGKASGLGLRASGDGGGQGGRALHGSGALDTGVGSGAGAAGTGRGRAGKGTGTGEGAGSGRGGERQLAAGGGAAPGQGLSAEQIARVVRARSGAFRACYESAAARDPKLQGGITVSFTVSPAGGVTARIASSSLENPRVESCVLRMFNRLHFPSADKPTSANWPLVFRPGK